MVSTSTRRGFAALLALLAASPDPVVAMDDMESFWRVDLMAERRFHSLSPAWEWKAKAWYGNDYHKLRVEHSGVLEDSGKIDKEGGTKGIDSRLFYSRLISDFWDAKAGVQLTVFSPTEHRGAFMAGVEGLAPYGFHIDAVASVTASGVVMARLEVSYDILFSHQLILTPFVEAVAATRDDRAIDLGSGLSRFELGLRLRYEIAKEFAPYIGVSFEQFTGNTAAFVASDGDPTSKLRLIVGLKTWF
jgi:copper resistance protein B